MKFIPILILLAGCAAPAKKLPPPSGIPPHIMPLPDTRSPSFEILRISEHKYDLQDGIPGQITKLYLIEVAADGGVWRVIIDRHNKVLMTRFR